MTIAVFGSANIDIDIFVTDLPKAGQTIHALGQKIGIGGKGANQAVAAKSLYDGEVRFVAAVGNDVFGEKFCDEIGQFNISANDIQRDRNNATGIALIHRDQDANNVITVCGGANMAWPDTGPDEKYFTGARVALFQLETPIKATLSAIEKAKTAGAITIIDPAPVPRSGIEKILSLADIITPNETEAEALGTGRISSPSDAMEAAAILRKRGPDKVIITLGHQGVAFCADDDNLNFIPAREIDAVDSVAAGDCFSGALATGMAEGMPFNEAVHFATAASALSVTKAGAAISMPSRQEVNQFILNQQAY